MKPTGYLSPTFFPITHDDPMRGQSCSLCHRMYLPGEQCAMLIATTEEEQKTGEVQKLTVMRTHASCAIERFGEPLDDTTRAELVSAETYPAMPAVPSPGHGSSSD